MMGKTAFIFPGQGSQYVGMGKDFYERIPVSRDVFLAAGEASGLPVREICFEENEKINVTEYTQIAILAAEVAMLRALEETGVRADVTAGLSLGEYGALAAAGAVSDRELFSVIRKRGLYMQEAVPAGGAMTAVLGLDAGIIEEICEKTPGQVGIANYNCPGQIVITGEEGAVVKAAEALKAAGAKRCVPLQVSGPFHSPMLEGAGSRLEEALRDINVTDPKIPYLANVTADYVTHKEQIKPLLAKQVSAPVKWQQTVEKMLADGVTTFIEIGPGKTLSGFLRKISRDALALHVEKTEDLEKVKEALGA